MVRADRARPERSVRDIYLREGSLRSPDGQWIAIKSQHIYGPQDVVLIKRDAADEEPVGDAGGGGFVLFYRVGTENTSHSYAPEYGWGYYPD